LFRSGGGIFYLKLERCCDALVVKRSGRERVEVGKGVEVSVCNAITVTDDHRQSQYLA
jgi:hypothetical protein